ncbi:MAG: serine hydrolase, partial [Pseudomonadota bacterium]|nr:serine hydrolase [Pseudomonadota bacterium]
MTTPVRQMRACVLAIFFILSALNTDILGLTDAQAEDLNQPTFEFRDALEKAQIMTRLHSLLVSWDGQPVLEQYFNGTTQRQLANVKSVSKSWISALVGIAIEQGYIESVQQPISDYFAEVLSEEDNALKRRITIEDLLTMQSGLETTSNRNYGAWVQNKNWVDYALSQPLELHPGTIMEYSTGNTHLLSAILALATGATTLEFARQALTKS